MEAKVRIRLSHRFRCQKNSKIPNRIRDHLLLLATIFHYGFQLSLVAATAVFLQQAIVVKRRVLRLAGLIELYMEIWKIHADRTFLFLPIVTQ